MHSDHLVQRLKQRTPQSQGFYSDGEFHKLRAVVSILRDFLFLRELGVGAAWDNQGVFLFFFSLISAFLSLLPSHNTVELFTDRGNRKKTQESHLLS